MFKRLNKAARQAQLEALRNSGRVERDENADDQDYEEQHMVDDVAPEVEAAKKGKRAYKKFLGY